MLVRSFPPTSSELVNPVASIPPTFAKSFVLKSHWPSVSSQTAMTFPLISWSSRSLLFSLMAANGPPSGPILIREGIQRDYTFCHLCLCPITAVLIGGFRFQRYTHSGRSVGQSCSPAHRWLQLVPNTKTPFGYSYHSYSR